MTDFNFTPARKPFPRWMGPYSPPHGTKAGFRVRDGKVGVWMMDGPDGSSFWSMAPSPSVDLLVRIVKDNWNGGSIFFLPCGLVVKPLREEEVGRRVVIGTFSGDVKLISPDGSKFDFGKWKNLRAGVGWDGPTTPGLECVMLGDGSLQCEWYHPTDEGRMTEREILRGPDSKLSAGFRAARPGDAAGRVRITFDGVVITNRKTGNTWESRYVGSIDPKDFDCPEYWLVRM
jgi:hypothetical protein